MKDPREHKAWDLWFLDADEEAGREYRPRLALLHADICARLDAKDKEAAALKDALGGALTELMALHGAPVPGNYRGPWTKAMARAAELLGAAADKGAK